MVSLRLSESRGNVARWEFAIVFLVCIKWYASASRSGASIDAPNFSKGSRLPSALSMWNRAVWTRTLPTLNCKLDTFSPARTSIVLACVCFVTHLATTRGNTYRTHCLTAIGAQNSDGNHTMLINGAD